MNKLYFVGLLALASCIEPTGRGCHARALVTFVIDDGSVTDYTVKKPIFDAHRAVAVSALISTREYLSHDQLREMQAAGWEIASHTRTHRDLTTLTQSELEDEIRGSQTELAARGFNTRTFVYPYGRSNTAVRRIAHTYYRATVRVGGGLNVWYRHADADLGRYNFGTRYALPGQNTMPFYRAQVDAAGSTGAWLIYMVHQLEGADAQNLGDLLNYIRGQGIPIVTVTQGLDLLECTPTVLASDRPR